MTVTAEIQKAINSQVPEAEIRTAAEASGMVPLHIDALAKVAAGVTSLDEALSVVRVT